MNYVFRRKPSKTQTGTKVIIEKSRGEVSLVEQETIENACHSLIESENSITLRLLHM